MNKKNDKSEKKVDLKKTETKKFQQLKKEENKKKYNFRYCICLFYF